MSPEVIERLEQGAMMHLRHNRIGFKVLDFDPNQVTVQVVQSKSPLEKYFSNKELSDIAKKLFKEFLPGMDIRSRPVEYVPPSVEHVTPEWIQQKLKERGLTQVKLVEETGIDKTNLSAWIAGNRPMSQPVKAMFWYMLR